jgi:MerR family transcriptional regulator, mercuric resistance operon regulatory protein
VTRVGTTNELTISGLAREAGVNVETVRYYERRHLLDAPPRTRGGYRTYGPSDVERMKFVRRAKDLGFTLHEISELLHHDGPGSASDVAAVAKAKLDQLDEEVRALIAQRCRLRQLLQICDHGDGANCVALMFDPPSPTMETQ